MNKGRILIIDDETEIRKSLTEILTDEGYAADSAGDAQTALMRIRETRPDCLLLDIKLGADDGMALLKKIREEEGSLPIIMITGHGTVALAAEAFRHGAQDFLEKPLRLVQVRSALKNALERFALRKSLANMAVTDGGEPVATSPVMRDLLARARKLSSIKSSVMILGPSGSGKEVVARTLHFAGSRAAGPFVATNAASMPVSLAEDELFGHEKGAFTGAMDQRIGRIEEADGGTLFLDEIADLAPEIQAKLLRVLETGEFHRLGGGKPVVADVRLVCATHKDMGALMKSGAFREDLYFRLSGFVLKVAPLSERREDIAPLAERFLQAANRETGLDRRFGEDALQGISSLPLPGNVRELRHIITRAAFFAENEVLTLEDIRNASSGPDLGRVPGLSDTVFKRLPDNFSDARSEFEKSFLMQALKKCNNSITLTAQKIGMAQSNLSRKLKELGLR